MFTPDIKSKISQIRVSLESVDRQLQTPGPSASIAFMIKNSIDRLGAAPPEAFVDFLREVDGLDFNGLTIFASTTIDDDLPGFVEENLDRFRTDLVGFDRTLVFGTDTFGFYALNLDSGVFRHEIWSGFDSREFKTFEEMLDHALSTVTDDST